MEKTIELGRAITLYLDAIYYCDVEKLEEVFHESSSLFDGDTGDVFVDPIASFSKDVGSRPSPHSINQQRCDEVILIDWLSELSAVVKVRLQSHDRIFVDHLSFVKGSRGWEIVSKVWHLEGNAEIIFLK